MKFIHTFAAFAAAAALGAVVLTPSLSKAADVCSWYVKKALQQQQVNVHERCGLQGHEWSTNPTFHLKWCVGAGPDKAKALVAERDRALAKCKQ